MKKPIMYTAAVAAIMIIAIVGCNDNVGNGVSHLNELLSSFGGGNNNGGEDPNPTDPTKPVLYDVQIVLKNGASDTSYYGGSYTKDSIVYINAGEPPVGYQFKEWTANVNVDFDNKNEAATAFKMPNSAIIVTAKFEPKMYKLEVKTQGNGKVSVNGAGFMDSIQGSYSYGTTIPLTAVPNDGHYFLSWKGAKEGEENSLVITMDGDKTLTAFFAKYGEARPLLVYFHGNHATSGNAPSPITDKKINDNIYLPDSGTLKKDGYSFSGWAIDTLYTEQTYSAGYLYTLRDDITFYAVWTAKTYTLTTSTSTPTGSNGGSVSCDQYLSNYPYGATVIATANANDGYTFSSWSGDVPQSHNTRNPVSIYMDSDKNLTANFVQQIKFTLTVNVGSGGGGTVTYTPQQESYLQGTRVGISANPSTNYEFDYWTVTNGQGQTTTGKSKDTTINMNSNMTFTANFKGTQVIPTPPPGPVAPQTTQDYAENGRLIINGKRVFISGMNIAWVDFSNDVGDKPFDAAKFRNYVRDIKLAGGNAVRWWLHTDATQCPKINSEGQVTGLGTKTIANIKQGLDTAYAYGVVVSLCLFSFDLLNNNNNMISQAQLNANEKFLTIQENLDTYITNGLIPMLDAVGNHPAIMCWEVFNEPEGMSNNAGGWSDKKVPMNDILRITARIAAVVHDKTLKMASTGIHEYGKMKTWYSDSKLKTAAGNDPLASKAYLDFYMAHYYPEYIGTSGSPFHNPASFWGMDRPILIGEFPAQSWGNGSGYGSIQSGTAMTITAAYNYAYNNGYCGALSWAMNDGNVAKFGNFTTTKPALENLYKMYKTDIDLGVAVPIVPTGDLAMKVALTDLPIISGNTAELGKDGDLQLSGKTNLSFEMYIAPGSGANMKVLPVVKVSDNWTWSPATNYAVDLSTKPTGQWFTVTIPISNGFIPESGTFDAGKVKAFILVFQPTGSPYTGTIYIDNIKADNTVLYDFNTLGSEWSMTMRDNSANVPVTGAAVSQAARSSIGSAKRRIAGLYK